MAINWRPAHFAHGAAGYEGGRIVADVVRYADIDHGAGHQVRGYYFVGSSLATSDLRCPVATQPSTTLSLPSSGH